MVKYVRVTKMTTKYKISKENAAEIKEYRQKVKDKEIDRRLHALQLLGEGQKSKEIAEKLDSDKRQISLWAKNFCERGGIEGFVKKPGGRFRENMSYEDEAKLLKQFKTRAEKGQIIEISEIKEEYDKLLGRKTNPTLIYSVLHRHGWRKVMPRSKHPKKADEEVIEASKKLNHN